MSDFEIKKISERLYVVNKAPEPLSKPAELKSEAILSYGRDNIYPQNLAKAIASSPVAKACTNNLYNYILGEGPYSENKTTFSEKVLKIANKIFPALIYDLAYFGGYSPQYIFDLNGNLSNINHIPFHSVRLGIHNDDCQITYAKICRDWNEYKKNKKFTYTIDLYDDDTFLSKVNFEKKDIEGFKKWNGLLDYKIKLTPLSYEYPEPVHASALDWIYCDGKIQKFHANNIDNAFMPSVLIYVPFDMTGKTDEEGIPLNVALKKKIMDMSGAENAGEPVIIHGPAEVPPTITSFNANSNHELFITLESLIKDNIATAYQTPPILAGIQVSGKLGGSARELYEASEWFYNNIARCDVISIEKWFNNIIKLMDGYDGTEIKIKRFNAINYIDSSLLNYFTEDEIRKIYGYEPKQLDDVSNNSENIISAINSLSPLVANKVLEDMTENERRALIGLLPKEGGNDLNHQEGGI